MRYLLILLLLAGCSTDAKIQTFTDIVYPFQVGCQQASSKYVGSKITQTEYILHDASELECFEFSEVVVEGRGSEYYLIEFIRIVPKETIDPIIL